MLECKRSKRLNLIKDNLTVTLVLCITKQAEYLSGKINVGSTTYNYFSNLKCLILNN